MNSYPYHSGDMLITQTLHIYIYTNIVVYGEQEISHLLAVTYYVVYCGNTFVTVAVYCSLYCYNHHRMRACGIVASCYREFNVSNNETRYIIHMLSYSQCK